MFLVDGDFPLFLSRRCVYNAICIEDALSECAIPWSVASWEERHVQYTRPAGVGSYDGVGVDGSYGGSG
jgi:hypothetical protein